MTPETFPANSVDDREEAACACVGIPCPALWRVVKRAIVTGCAGFVGANLVRRLVRPESDRWSLKGLVVFTERSVPAASRSEAVDVGT